MFLIKIFLNTSENQYGSPDNIIKYLIEQDRMISSSKDSKPETVVNYVNSLCNLVSAVKQLESEIYLKIPLLLGELVSNLTVNLKQF